MTVLEKINDECYAATNFGWSGSRDHHLRPVDREACLTAEKKALEQFWADVEVETGMTGNTVLGELRRYAEEYVGVTDFAWGLDNKRELELMLEHFTNLVKLFTTNKCSHEGTISMVSDMDVPHTSKVDVTEWCWACGAIRRVRVDIAGGRRDETEWTFPHTASAPIGAKRCVKCGCVNDGVTMCQGQMLCVTCGSQIE